MSGDRKCEDCGDDMAKRRFRCPVCHYASRTKRRMRGANSRSAAVPPEIKHHPDCPAAYFGFKPGVTCSCDVNRSQS